MQTDQDLTVRDDVRRLIHPVTRRTSNAAALCGAVVGWAVALAPFARDGSADAEAVVSGMDVLASLASSAMHAVSGLLWGMVIGYLGIRLAVVLVSRGRWTATPGRASAVVAVLGLALCAVVAADTAPAVWATQLPLTVVPVVVCVLSTHRGLDRAASARIDH